MRTLWTFHRRAVVTVGLVAVLALSTIVALTAHHSRPHGMAPERGGQPTARTRTTPSRNPMTPAHALPPTPITQSATQRHIDGELAQSETPAAIAAARAISVPAPAVSTAYPSIPTADRRDPGAYGTAFVTELLDTDYALASRHALLAWAEHEEAPNTLPGVPTSVGSKALVLSLADPDLPGGTPSPLPSAPQWAADAQAGVTQSVTGVQAEVDPDWTQIITEGWQPRDPLMTIETVTGMMTVVTAGVAAVPEPFSLSVTLGSATSVRSGYGAVAVGNWVLN